MPMAVRVLILSGVTGDLVMIGFSTWGMWLQIDRGVSQVYWVFNACLVVVMLGLGYGICRGSRTCALLAFGTYALLHAIVAFTRHVIPNGLTLAVGALFLLGMIGTFRWHGWRADYRRTSIELARRRALD